ncbi:MAG: MDR-like protein ABC transporter [uncultured bacterium (gcode 4)]|uniref:MDR-like protein ABC transporter n=1 Tax=uncultured bacterium (gcode 4) TaxID=1234023 RepID=K2GV80_9BACT|nr:MAG: MDR-like protein ABC transporter [uncultured bacterium (gcode 4)]
MFKKLKTLLYPIKFVKKAYFVLLFSWFINWFQRIFQIQILAFIVWAIQSKNLWVFNFWLINFVIIQLIGFIVIYVSFHAFSISLAKIRFALSETYLAKFLKLDNNKIESLGSWRANSIISKWIDNWSLIITETFQDIFISITSMIYAFWVIYFTAWIKFFSIVIFLFSINFLWAFYFNNLWLQFRSKRKDEEVAFDRNFIKIIMSKFEILQNNKFSHEANKLKNITWNILNLWWKEDDRWTMWIIWVNLIISLILFTIFIYIWKWVINWNFQLSYFVLIYWLVDILERHTRFITNNIREFWIKIVHVDKLLETFENIKEIWWINNITPFLYSKWDIKINNLTFWYWDDNIFNDLLLELIWWKKTAIVWDSWSWKTTLMKLIAWYLHPKSGEIIIDNQNIQNINLISYYKHIWYLTQDPSVFDWTVLENLTYALDREPTKEELEFTIKNSKCEFIYELPNWFETEIWERWVKLSWGQKQRLAIAKIMIKNPNIILLDEPTSALDSISEQVVSEALHNLFKWRTVIVIAHRLQTVKEADDIIVLKSWKILERWSHEQLSQIENWEYKKMLDLQTSF